MVQEVKYNGQTAIPDDYSAPDGDLEVSLNLIHEDGALKPIPKPDVMYKVGDGNRVRSLGDPRIVFIHKTANYTHYIQALTVEKEGVYQTDPPTFTNLMWIDEGSPNPYDIGDLDVEFKEIVSVGNVLCVLCEDELYYYLWTNDTYKFIGNHPPALPLSFGLQSHVASSANFKVETNSKAPWSLYNTIDPTTTRPFPQIIFDKTSSTIRDFVAETTSIVMANVNTFIEEKATKAGRFIFPFLVRYAFRLYDGVTLIMHSSPILMVPSSGSAPRVTIFDIQAGSTTAQDTYIDYIEAQIAALVCDIDYMCDDSTALNDLITNWSDIIESVDIFISAPFYTFNQAGTIEGFECRSATQKGNYTISKIENTTGRYIHAPNNDDYAKMLINPLIFEYYNVGQHTLPGVTEYILPRVTGDNVEKIKECGTFYKLASIKLADIQTTRTKIDIKSDYLGSLVAKEVMSDEYHSHDAINANVSFVYNSRLNLADITRRYANPFNPQSCVCFCDNIFEFNESTKTYSAVGRSDTVEHFPTEEIKNRAGSYIYLLGKGTDTLHDNAPFLYYYHPESTATKITITVQRDASFYLLNPALQKSTIDLPLEKHSNLNGAVYFEGFSPDNQSTWSSIENFEPWGETDISDVSEREPNKVYLSFAENPFAFPASHICSVGDGTILGLSSATQAISQGQFGQNPLYCFTTDGVWALSVSKEGVYTTTQPVTRDVCTTRKSITSIDNAVLFAADRGIMLIAGGQTTCISDTIADQFPFDLARLPKLLQVFTTAVTLAPFDEFLQGCQMIYDYTHQRIIVFNGTLLDDTDLENDRRKTYNKIVAYPYAYVYSLKSKKWGMMNSNIYAKVNSYPEALAITFPIKPLAVATVSTLSSDEPIGGDDDPPVEMPPSFLPATSDLVNFSAEIGGTTTIPTGLMVTRPIKLGASDTLKEIKTLIQRGFFERGEVATVLYGSRDLISWHLIGSSTDNFLRHIHGTGYKYFRIAAITNLTAEHSLHGASMEAKARHTDKLK